MSFIYDDKSLISELIKLSQTPDKQFIDLAKRLIQNLQTELAGGTVFTADRADADLDQVDLVDLNSLFNFLYYNGIRANNKILVFRAQNFDLNSLGDDAKLYVPYPSDDPDYYVYRAGLTAYLNDLKNKAANNPMLMANINRLIPRISSELPEKTAPETKPSTSTAPGQPTQEQDENGEYEQTSGNAGKSRGGLTTQDLRKFLNRFPLLEDRIDFQRIRNFVTAYTQITGQTPGAINNINAELQKLNTNFKVGNAQGFPTSADEVARIIPQGVHPYAYFSTLYSLIVNVKQLLNYLKSANYDYMDDELKAQIDQQVGTGSNDGNAIAVQNLADLQDYMREAQNWRRTR